VKKGREEEETGKPARCEKGERKKGTERAESVSGSDYMEISQVINRKSNSQCGSRERSRRAGDFARYRKFERRRLDQAGTKLGIWLAVLAVLLIAAAGCATATPPAPRPVLVDVPVPSPVYCVVSPLYPPALAIAALRSDSPAADTIRSYAASVMVLKSAVKQRDAILQACAAPADANAGK